MNRVCVRRFSRGPLELKKSRIGQNVATTAAAAAAVTSIAGLKQQGCVTTTNTLV